MWIGVDDTDGPDGGCTTFVLTSIVGAARNLGFDLLGYPRLVRLDPNVPWKTRGNGALAVRFGRGRGPSQMIGEIDGRPVRSFPRGDRQGAGAEDRLFEAARAEVKAGSSRARRTDPALVAAPRCPESRLYRRAVSEVVARSLARRALQEAGGRSWFRGSARGIVGATAAIAWPGRRRTFELLAYREPDRIGTRREVDAASVREAARRHPELFLCYDERTRRLLVAPHTACPILFGLRSTRAGILPEILHELRSEPVGRWLIFATNQGTGDHLTPRRGGAWPPYAAGSVEGTVRSVPEVLPGGHVRFQLSTGSGASLECWAFEPTKSLPKVARTLLPGDRVRVDAGRGSAPELHLEGITLLHLEERRGPARAPRCPRCRRATESRGAGRGYRCPQCRTRFPPESARAPVVPPEYPPGRYDPTPSARRHLHPRAPEPR